MEHFDKSIYLYQAYESFYTLDQSINAQKHFTIENFEEELKNLFSANEDLVKSAIEDLFCYDDEKCETIKKTLSNGKHVKLVFSFENLKNILIKIRLIIHHWIKKSF